MRLSLSRFFHFASFIFFVVVCFCGWRVAKKFGVVTLDQIFFHLMAPMDGMDKELVVWGIRYTAITLGIIVLYCVWAFSRRAAGWMHKVRPLRFIHSPDSPKWHTLLGIAFLSVTVVFAELRYEAYTYFFAKESPFIQENYAVCKPEDVSFPRRKNAVILILESMEDTYNDIRVFPEPLMPKLKALQEQHLSFHQKQIYGTGWTIAGLTSYFFGLPLLLFKNQGNVLFDKFMPEASNILTVLEHHGYTLEYVQSGSIVFAGTDKLFGTHSKTVIQDAEFLSKHKPENATGMWGIPDSFMYSWAKDRYLELAKQDKPFALIVQTIDTHGYGGFIEKHNIRHGDFRDVLNAADNMAADFIEWLKRQEGFEDTAIIVLGDHLTGKNPLYQSHLIPNQQYRRISNLFINAFHAEGADRSRQCSSVDMAPTILEAMGAELPRRRLGLGVSLFSEEKNLIEKMGLKGFDDALKQKSEFYKSLF